MIYLVFSSELVFIKESLFFYEEPGEQQLYTLFSVHIKKHTFEKFFMLEFIVVVFFMAYEVFCMIQKNVFLTNLDEVKETLADIGNEFEPYHDGVIEIMVGNVPDEDVRELVELLKTAFPRFKITGLSSTGMIAYSNYRYKSIICLNFNLFDRSEVIGFSREFDINTEHLKQEAIEYAKELREEIKKIEDVKCVEIYFAWLKASVSNFIEVLSEGLEEIPIYGSIATANSVELFNEYVVLSSTDAVIINNDFIGTGVSAVVYRGKDLYVYSEYLLGWKPVGRYMDVGVCNVTGDGRTVICSIDGQKPLDIYYKYLGVRPNKDFVNNICEFPLIIERDGIYIARTPSAYAESGEVFVEGDIRQGEKVRFSYAEYEHLLEEAKQAAGRMARFSPEGMSALICGNRFMFLQKDHEAEVNFYSEGFGKSPFLVLGMGEIYRYGGKGGMLNSAFVAVGMKEGLGDGMYSTIVPPIRMHYHEGIIPLHERLAHFLKAMTEELVDAVKKANAASEAKSTFLSGMSHEIRTPINAVLGMDEMILRESGDKQILEYAQNIKTAGNTLLSLVNDILDFSKIEAGKMDIIPVDYDFSSVINDLVHMIKPRAEAKGLEVIADIDTAIPSVLNGDEIRMKQVITNILTNAVKYTEKGSVTLKICSKKTADDEISLKVSVRDTGIGIKESDRNRLYSAFQRVDEVRNRTVEGTGLGLNITRRLLELMGSSLELESEYGRGSDFHFSIRQKVVKWDPIGDYMESYRKSMEQRESYHEKFTAPDCEVLAVDDTAMNLSVFVGLLKKTQVKIDTASSGMECLEKSRLKKYDMIFLDHRMPEMDGIETLKRLKSEEGNPNRETVTISLTANVVSGAREQYIEAGLMIILPNL